MPNTARIFKAEFAQQLHDAGLSVKWLTMSFFWPMASAI
jgi:hypothetical protein